MAFTVKFLKRHKDPEPEPVEPDEVEDTEPEDPPAKQRTKPLDKQRKPADNK
jgi:hypothetical protein